jgi:hypothetical protein
MVSYAHSRVSYHPIHEYARFRSNFWISGESSFFITLKKRKLVLILVFSQIASIHYEQPEPVLSVRKLDRTVQISHWGNHVAIEDEILLVNDGPK